MHAQANTYQKEPKPNNTGNVGKQKPLANTVRAQTFGIKKDAKVGAPCPKDRTIKIHRIPFPG